MTADNQRRRYNSPVRRQQRETTRQKIINAGAELVQNLPTWDMQSLTFKAVGEQAGVSERTVYRYFATERQLKESIVQYMVAESGINLDQLRLSNFSQTTGHMFRQISAFAATSKQEIDPTFAAVDQERRTAVLQAVTIATPGWNDVEQRQVAAMLDTLWDVPPFQRILAAWGLNTEQAIDAITWVIGLVEGAINTGNRPPSRD